MTHAASSEHGTPVAGSHGHDSDIPSWQSLFSPAEWEMYRRDDWGAGRNIVCLLTGVFCTGLIGYLFVALWVANNW
jgi:hypothetical protein